MKKLSFPIFWEWVLACSRPITYDTQLELFCLLFDAYSVETDKHYTAVQVSRYASGKEHLPRRMVSKYWLVEDYISDLEEAVLTVLVPAIPDLPGAIDQLICIVGEDDTLTRGVYCWRAVTQTAARLPLPGSRTSCGTPCWCALTAASKRHNMVATVPCSKQGTAAQDYGAAILFNHIPDGVFPNSRQ